jgi:hypothetical protein
MKKINFPDENGYGIPFLILIILILPYSHYFFPLLIPKLYSFEKYPILIIILSSILLISIILSVLHLIKCFKVKNFISIGTFSLSIILLLTVLTSSYYNSPKPETQLNLCRCLTEPGTTEWYKKTREECNQLISKEIGVNDWEKVNFSKNPILNSRWQSLKISCGR